MRVRDARVEVAGRVTGDITDGLLVYVGVGAHDSERDVDYLVDKTVNLRIFPDEEGKMNRSLREAGGGVLVVSQFTLYGDVRKGRRPSYSAAASPDKADALYQRFLHKLKAAGVDVAAGEFRAMMEVISVNQGPVTILLDSERLF